MTYMLDPVATTPPLEHWSKRHSQQPTAVADAEKLVRHGEGCQFFAKRTHVPAHEIQTIL